MTNQVVSTDVKLCVIGCPRSGTGYTAQVLRDAGYDVGHEFRGENGIVSWKPWQWDLSGESLVLHQVRDPLDCIASMQTIISDENMFHLLSTVVTLDFDPHKRSIADLSRIWLLYNAQCEALANETYKVESEIGWNTACEFSGLPQIPRNASEATNHRKHDPLTWDDIRREAGSLICDRIQRATRHYGYPI